MGLEELVVEVELGWRWGEWDEGTGERWRSMCAGWVEDPGVVEGKGRWEKAGRICASFTD